MANKDGFKYKLSAVFDVLGEILAFLTIIIYAVWLLDANLHFVTNDTFALVLEFGRTWAPLILVCVVGLEFAVKRNIVIQIVIYAIIALVIILMFFPGTWEAIRGAVGL